MLHLLYTALIKLAEFVIIIILSVVLLKIQPKMFALVIHSVVSFWRSSLGMMTS